ncbi:uncharacterized protein isoform X1 [Danio rerio]|uniref:Uncharacterized protein isoform X1 n=2 Tax=Danio rerio TaxID=7955 RepID=A0A8M9PBJ7_DANRE|nr:uncharacterized protein LOC100034589 isoform X1 [Danio rerio]XP_021324023.1 uncharacterized protein LOC100034589 isoform X1 [Danio rerio]XP_021324024.1 uncharacterized protein LOC100034589 isoform X1 [Danio rerio]|eukprot:XP_021324022.1 uncharacterized protein LOC100034589 isoform X1 [Danio rerio]
MLVKVQYQGVKKYVKLLTDFTFQYFISEVKSKFGLPTTADLQVFDDTDTNVEEDIFHELMESSPHVCLTVRCLEENMSAGLPEVISPTRSSTASTCTDTVSLSSTDHDDPEQPMQNQMTRASRCLMVDAERAKRIVQDALEKQSGGDEVLDEYKATKTLKHSTRRQLVNIVVSHMTEIHGRIPTRKQRETYALGIISLFPSLRDPFSAKGYVRICLSILNTNMFVCFNYLKEHFYDPEKGTGFIAWRLKTLSRKNPKRVRLEVSEVGGPSLKRRIDTGQQLEGDACREAISFLVHTADESEVLLKMKETFKRRQELVHDPKKSADILNIFPRFLDVKGLINQDFGLLFNAETSNKLLERWETSFKHKIINEAKSLTSTAEIRGLINSAEGQGSENDWDSDMSAVLLLLHLLPPSSGRKRTKISPTEAVERLVHFHKSCTSIEGHLSKREGHQPYLLGTGRIKGRIDNFYVVMDKHLIPCAGTSSLSAVDELFKIHYVFNLTYEEALVNIFTFLQTTVYNIDVGLTSESPRVKELRAKILN